jgi:D-glycero-D-manno-heptose 1,7-bisphosphate phosphatase
MDPSASLIILDRDGVLNQTLHNPHEARRDSPLRVEDVVVFPWVPALLRRLTDAGFALSIASNQPAFAKGKVSRKTLEDVHERVLREVRRDGAVISSSHVCFHRSEDGCSCRKPKPGLLLEALALHPAREKAESWMVGDRASDVLAGASIGLNTALLADVHGVERRELEANAVEPAFYAEDLRDFGQFLLAESRKGGVTHETQGR